MSKTTDNHARWKANYFSGTWGLFARARDGGALLARIMQRDSAYYWGLGVDAPQNRCESLYAAQRAVRRALREASE